MINAVKSFLTHGPQNKWYGAHLKVVAHPRCVKNLCNGTVILKRIILFLNATIFQGISGQTQGGNIRVSIDALPLRWPNTVSKCLCLIHHNF